jgi:nucleoside-diphosphate-sugar epimerase
MDERNIADIAQMVVECFGRQAKIIPGELPKGGANRRCPDIEKAEALGFKPGVSIEVGVERTVDWYLGRF